MSRTYTAYQFGAHLFRSRRWDSFHSPYLFRLFTHCCEEKNTSPFYDRIEKQRHQLKSSKEIIPRKDFGAGSNFSQKAKTDSISTIAAHALSLPFQCRFLYRLAGFINPVHILEFGTSLGISAAYLAAGAPGASIDTVEGDPEIAARALNVFENLGFTNIQIHISTFDVYLGENVNSTLPIDLLFLDGHHTSAALMNYYHGLKEHLHSKSILIVDDLYWSEDMKDGWNKLIALPEVTQSVDCFHFGMIFFNPDFHSKENHIIRLPLRMQLK